MTLFCYVFDADNRVFPYLCFELPDRAKKSFPPSVVDVAGWREAYF